jgi:Fe-S oxidoreductase
MCGYDVRILPVIGAGAALMSKGMLDAAKRHAGNVLDALDQIDPAREAVVVGIEPPEIYAFKHDYPDLLPARMKEIASRASKTWLLDEFLLRSDEFDKLRVVNIEQLPSSINDSTKKVYLHPHCHQRAEGLSPDGRSIGAQATLDLLRACGFEVEELDTGCCGMAGTFGYESEHYNLSMKVGELKLFPKLNGLGSEMDDWLAVSTGAACRMQIKFGTGVDAVHPIQLVAQTLERLRR